MCKQCLVLGALINVGRSSNHLFPCQSLSKHNFCFENQTSKIDETALEYLSETLRKFQENGVDLVPHQVDSDGSCLPHALSICLTGVELFYDALRAELVQELTSFETWYRSVLPDAHLFETDEDWALNWKMNYVDPARPTRGKLVDRERYLSNLHILAFANILKRPILLLDRSTEVPHELRMMQLQAMESRSGLFLPLRHASREELLRGGGYGESGVPGPLVIGWSSSSHSHFISLVPRKLPPSPTETALTTHLSAQMSFFGLSPALRTTVSLTLLKYTENLHRALQSADLRAVEKCSRIRFTNQTFADQILPVPGAVELLKAVGYTEVEEAVGEGMVKCLRFALPSSASEIAQCSERLNLLRQYLLSLSSAPHRNQPLSVVDLKEGCERELFGPAPFLYTALTPAPGEDLWALCLRLYGHGLVSQGLAWSFMAGQPCRDLPTPQVEMNFNHLAKNIFPPLRQLTPHLIQPRSMHSVTCYKCEKPFFWSADSTLAPDLLVAHLDSLPPPSLDSLFYQQCPSCRAVQSISGASSLRINAFLHTVYLEETGIWSCEERGPEEGQGQGQEGSPRSKEQRERCGAANFGSDLTCHNCSAPRTTKRREREEGESLEVGVGVVGGEESPTEFSPFSSSVSPSRLSPLRWACSLCGAVQCNFLSDERCLRCLRPRTTPSTTTPTPPSLPCTVCLVCGDRYNPPSSPHCYCCQGPLSSISSISSLPSPSSNSSLPSPSSLSSLPRPSPNSSSSSFSSSSSSLSSYLDWGEEEGGIGRGREGGGAEGSEEEALLRIMEILGGYR